MNGKAYISVRNTGLKSEFIKKNIPFVFDNIQLRHIIAKELFNKLFKNQKGYIYRIHEEELN